MLIISNLKALCVRKTLARAISTKRNGKLSHFFQSSNNPSQIQNKTEQIERRIEEIMRMRLKGGGGRFTIGWFLCEVERSDSGSRPTVTPSHPSG